jgi:peroxiredoxin
MNKSVTSTRHRRGFLIAVVVATLCFSAANAARDLVGFEAPDFALRSSLGENLRLSEYRGQVVMLNFWATWCGPCRQEMPLLEDIYGRYEPAGFSLLAINLDEENADALDMASDLGVTFPLLFDDEKTVSRLYDIRAMPMTVLIDRDGRVRHVHQGYRPGYESRYLDEVRSLLREDEG